MQLCSVPLRHPHVLLEVSDEVTEAKRAEELKRSALMKKDEEEL
jgi:hypothetical protein